MSPKVCCKAWKSHKHSAELPLQVKSTVPSEMGSTGPRCSGPHLFKAHLLPRPICSMPAGVQSLEQSGWLVQDIHTKALKMYGCIFSFSMSHSSCPLMNLLLGLQRRLAFEPVEHCPANNSVSAGAVNSRFGPLLCSIMSACINMQAPRAAGNLTRRPSPRVAGMCCCTSAQHLPIQS